MRRTAPTGALVMVALLASTTALSYVIPAASILRRVVERREEMRLNTLLVTGSSSFTGDAAREFSRALGQAGDMQADARFALKLPGRCRVEVSSVDGRKVAAISAHGKARFEGAENAWLTQALAQACPLLAMRPTEVLESRDRLLSHVRSLGVDPSQTSLARFDGKIVYVVGKLAQGQPQLWIYKDSFLPARLLYKGQDGAQWDVRFRNFGSPVAGDWFPRILEVARGTGDESMFRFTALGADARAPVADALF